jgi:hypothetical protein
VLGGHVGHFIELVGELPPLGALDALLNHWEQFSVIVVPSAHLDDEHAEHDGDDDEDQEGETPELDVLLLSGLAFLVDEIQAEEQTEEATDGRDVDHDLEISVGVCHLGFQGGHDWN